MKKTAGELAKQALQDTTKYDALEVGHAVTEEIDKHLRDSIELYKDRIDQNEFCVVMVLADDPLIKNLVRRKYYCWPFLPKPRPNQSVFLYNKRLDRITKRLWVLPSPAVMAELSEMTYVDKRYETMQAWSIAFFKGTFWEFVRHHQDITMLSEHEHHLKARKEAVDSGLNLKKADAPDAFDFSKIALKNLDDPIKAAISKNTISVRAEV